jgi:hypothetical protein
MPRRDRHAPKLERFGALDGGGFRPDMPDLAGAGLANPPRIRPLREPMTLSEGGRSGTDSPRRRARPIAALRV